MTERSPTRPGSADTVKPAILGIMLNLIRTSSLASKVDVSAMMAFMSMQWPVIFRDGVLDLEPVRAELIQLRGVTEQELAQIFLLLKKREDRLSVQVKLPPTIAAMPSTQQEALLREVARLGVQSGVTIVGMKRVEPRPQDAPAHPQQGLAEKVRALLNKKE